MAHGKKRGGRSKGKKAWKGRKSWTKGASKVHRKKHKSGKKQARKMSKVIPADEYQENNSQMWSSNVATQGILLNITGGATLAPIMGDPSLLQRAMIWEKGFVTEGPQRFFVKSEDFLLSVKDTTNGGSDCDIYFWRCRRDLPITADYTSLVAFYTFGLTKTNGAVAITAVGTSPFINPLWCHYFKCFKMKKLKGADKPSESQRTIRLRNKPYRFDTLYDGGASTTAGNNIEYLALAKRTVVMMPVVRGAMAHDVSNLNAISCGTGAYMALWTTKLKINLIENAAHNTIMVNNLTAPTTYRSAIDNTIVTAAPAIL